jgi:hypothetical protein
MRIEKNCAEPRREHHGAVLSIKKSQSCRFKINLYIRWGVGMEHLSCRYRSLLGAAAGFLFAGLLIAGGATPASAQAANAADLCTPDVMRLCQDFIPDRNRIVACLKAKRRSLSDGCRQVMAPKAKPSKRKKKAKRARHRRG